MLARTVTQSRAPQLTSRVALNSKHSFFREIEHTGDTGIEIQASTRDEMFALAALAMARLIVDEKGIERRECRRLEVSGRNDADIIHDLLASALNLFLIDGFIWCDCSAKEHGKSITLNLEGERFDSQRHTLLGEIKAVTYHQLAVTRRAEDCWTARIIFDI
jgi:protein archease